MRSFPEFYKTADCRKKEETMYKNVYVNEWVEQMAKMTQPDSIVWIDGSEEERERLTKQAVSTGEMM